MSSSYILVMCCINSKQLTRCLRNLRKTNKKWLGQNWMKTVIVLFTFSRTCSYTAIGLLLKVMALQKLACLLTVLCDISMMICEPLVLGWNSRGKEGKFPHCWMGRQRLGLWWQLWDVAGNGPFRESIQKEEERREGIEKKKVAAKFGQCSQWKGENALLRKKWDTKNCTEKDTFFYI